MKKHMLVGPLLGVSLVLFLFLSGCVGQPVCEPCPEGFTQLENCTCVPIEENTATVKEGDELTLAGWNIYVKSISEDIEYENGQCIVSNEKIKLKLEKGEESATVTLKEGGSEDLGDDLFLFVNDISQMFTVNKEGCIVTDKEVEVRVVSAKTSSRTVTIPVTESTTLSDGTALNVKSVDIIGRFIEPVSDHRIYEEGDSEDITEEITVKLISITETLALGETAETVIEKGEGEQASLPGDYTIRILDITQNVGAPDSDTITDYYEINDKVELEDNTKVEIKSITITTSECNDTLECNATCGCDIENETVTLRVRPEGGSAQDMTAEEGETINASDRVVVDVLDIDEAVSCVDEECVVENKTVQLRITTYADECTITDRKVDLELLFPDLSAETFSLGYGDEKTFLTGERVKVLSITENMKDSVAGMCDINNEEVRLQLTLPSTECGATNKKAKIRLTEGSKNYDFTISEGSNRTTGKNNNLIVSVPLITVETEYNEDTKKCEAVSERADIEITVEADCTLVKEDAELKHGTSTYDILFEDSIEIGDIEIELYDLLADVEIDEENEKCIISNKKAKLRINEPVLEEFTLEEGDSEEIDDLEVSAIAITYITEEADGECVFSDKEAELGFSLFGDETTKTVEEGDFFEMGDFLVTILEISGDMTNEPTYECIVTDRQADIEIGPTIITTEEIEEGEETADKTTNETADETTNETEEDEE